MTPGHILVVVDRFLFMSGGRNCLQSFFFPHQVPAEDLPIMNHCPQGKCFSLSPIWGQESDTVCMVHSYNALLILILEPATMFAKN